MIEKEISKIYIPKFLCNSVSGILEKHGYNFEYYEITDNFLPNFKKELSNNEYIYIVNYFGQLTNETLEKLKENYTNVIVDNTQSFFQKPVLDIDTLYSCRKYFGVPDGAYLATSAKPSLQLERDVSKDRLKHLIGRYEDEQAAKYYKDFKENDYILSREPLKKMSYFTQNILGAIDYNQVKIRRENNYKILDDAFREINNLSLLTPEGPFVYPLYLNNGYDLKEKLIRKKIYIPTLWPNVLKASDEKSLEYNYAKHILPIPCDQRYSTETINYLVGVIKECLN